MRLSEGNPFKTCASPQAHDQKINRANLYENEIVKTYRDLKRFRIIYFCPTWFLWFLVHTPPHRQKGVWMSMGGGVCVCVCVF